MQDQSKTTERTASSAGAIRIVGGSVLGPTGWDDVTLSSYDGFLVEEESSSAALLDASGCVVVPGFVDLQVNGGWGIDLASKPEGLWELGAKLASCGVTAWLPTLVSTPPGAVGSALRALKTRPAGWMGAEPLGWHLEGPWLNPVRNGAHRVKHLRPPTLPLDPMLGRSSGVRLVTLAPELPGGLDTVAELVERGVVVSLGHSDCDAGLAQSAFAAGATMGTHLFNAMSGLHHRTPGLAAALLTSGVSFGLIADGIHVSPTMVDLAWKSTNTDQLVLVSDMIAGLGLPVGITTLGPFEVHLDGVSARLADGTLAGSVLDMATAVRNLMSFTECSLEDAVAAATRAPATVLAETSRGELSPGRRADIVVLDSDLDVVATVVAGNLVYERDANLRSSTDQ